MYIRADGNARIGTGHIMRCLSIAKVARSRGMPVIFVVADKAMEALLQQQGFPFICLDSVWDNLDEEIEKMEHLIYKQKIKKLLIDSYFVTPNYLQQLHLITHVAYMDDLNAFYYPCSTLINYNIYAEKFGYSSRYHNTKLLLGSAYAPLRNEFQNIPKRIVKDTVQKILVTTGGTDPYNIAGKLVAIAKQRPGTAHLEYHIVAGPFNQYANELQQLSRKYKGIVLHHNVQNMSELMLDCDVAVSAGGSTLYELCACGTPSVFFTMADNQVVATQSLGSLLQADFKDIRPQSVDSVKDIYDDIVYLIQDFKLRKHISQTLQNLVDGNGAKRIIEQCMYE